jgi:hypothetical protein
LFCSKVVLGWGSHYHHYPRPRRRDGERDGRRVKGIGAVRALARSATRWMRVVSSASARLIVGKMVVSRRASLVVPAPGGPRRRTLWSQRLHSVHPNMQRSMTCQPMGLLPRRRGQHGSPRSTRRGQLERTQVFGHGSQLAMNDICSQNVLDIVDMTAYFTRATPRGLLTSRAQQPSPQEDPRCLSSLRS